MRLVDERGATREIKAGNPKLSWHLAFGGQRIHRERERTSDFFALGILFSCIMTWLMKGVNLKYLCLIALVLLPPTVFC